MTDATNVALGAHYTLLRQLGSGAAGVVWEAADDRTPEHVAAKVLRAEHAADDALTQRFFQEQALLKSLVHPSIVAFRDLVVEGGRVALITDLMTAGSLRDQVRRGPLEPALAVAVTARVLDGVDAAHAKGVLHRDLKPDNVLLNDGWRELAPGAIRVSDFGISRILTDGRGATTGLIGTPHYMAPEMIRDGVCELPADIYAAGILLYELLTAHTPFEGPGTDYTVAHRHVTQPPAPLDVPGSLWQVLASMLAKDPASRPTAAEAALRLRRLLPELAGLPVLPAPTGHATPAPAPGHQATILKGAAPKPAGPADEQHHTVLAPQHAAPGAETMLKPLRPLAPKPAAVAAESAPAATWWSKPRIALVAGGAALLLAGGSVLAWQFGKPPAPQPTASAQPVVVKLVDDPLPTGLTVAREARYDPASGVVDLNLTYAGQKAPLTGPFLEVLPGAHPNDACPDPHWEQVAAEPHRPVDTGIDVACGWAVPASVPVGQKATIRARVPVRLPADKAQSELERWLAGAAAATKAAVDDARVVNSVAYPVQRLRGVRIDAPPKAVNQNPLEITVVPVWASGADSVNLLYKSPSLGTPSTLLTSVAGRERPLEFTDGCSGALAVSPDGMSVTALAMAPQCTVRARVGNFTDLASRQFSIVARGG